MPKPQTWNAGLATPKSRTRSAGLAAPKPRRGVGGPKTRHTTVPSEHPPRTKNRRRPAPRNLPPQPAIPPLPATRNRVGRITDDEDRTLLDVIDSLLSKGAMVNADLILALADVDLVYIRLSALLCAADRVLRQKR